MIRELEEVVLAVDIPAHDLKAGDVGVVVHEAAGVGYMVEFMTLGGETLAVVPVSPDQIRPFAADEIPHARKVVPARG